MDWQHNSAPALSLEASLDAENKEVLAAMNEQQRSRSPKPKVGRGVTPPPPIRSMLDVSSTAPRHGSIAGIGVGITNPRDERRPSARLDPSDPSTWTRPHRAASRDSRRSSVDTDSRPQRVPRIQIDSGDDFEQKYQFDMASIPSAVSHNQRNTSSDKNANRSSSQTNKSRETLSTDRQSSQERHQRPSSRSTDTDTRRTRTSPSKTKSLSSSSVNMRRSSNKSSSFSDTSEKPSELADHTEGSDEEAVVESSDVDEENYDDDDDDDQEFSSDADSPKEERGRGREKLQRKDGQSNTDDDQSSTGGLAPQAKGVRSLLDPVSSPSRPAHHSSDVHPPSSFGRSGPSASDLEQDPADADVQKAKSLGLSISPVDSSIADRHVRMIIRGEWAKFQDETENHNHTSRLYLTCSDLSTEATYALEWTVGTMLRDGDTLLAIYAIEDESAPKETEGNKEVMAESAKAAHDASETMATLTRQTTNLSDLPTVNQHKFIPVTEATSLTGSVDARNTSKKEMERLRAMDEITQTFLKLVRKTALQVRCMVEVIHCKSPKHLILNAIDELDPTLCVVGTRGRSSLKGVLLGSFSNYLVTKSSVPVMVARKRLKKPRHAKVNSASIRLSNNLTNSLLPRQRRGLTQARID